MPLVHVEIMIAHRIYIPAKIYKYLCCACHIKCIFISLTKALVIPCTCTFASNDAISCVAFNSLTRHLAYSTCQSAMDHHSMSFTVSNFNIFSLQMCMGYWYILAAVNLISHPIKTIWQWQWSRRSTRWLPHGHGQSCSHINGCL